MRKIDNWEKITAFQKLSPGGYICGIRGVVDVPEKEYLKIEYDIIEGDNKGYFTKKFKENTRKDKKWPTAGTFYRSYKESSQPMFKGFITSIEKSNPDFKWDWDESKLKNKKVGLVIGEEEYLNQKGQVRITNKVRSVHSVDTIKEGNFEIPEIVKLENTKVLSQQEKFIDPFEEERKDDEEFNDAELDIFKDITEDEIPF